MLHGVGELSVWADAVALGGSNRKTTDDGRTVKAEAAPFLFAPTNVSFGAKQTSRNVRHESAIGGNLLQNYFGPQSGEHFSKSGAEQGIFIQETALADSIIAHFGWSTAHWPSFATD
jgi:hypothetical protein